MGRSVLMCPEWEYMGKKVDNSGFTTMQTLQNSTSLYFPQSCFTQKHTVIGLMKMFHADPAFPAAQSRVVQGFRENFFISRRK